MTHEFRSHYISRFLATGDLIPGSQLLGLAIRQLACTCLPLEPIFLCVQTHNKNCEEHK